MMALGYDGVRGRTDRERYHRFVRKGPGCWEWLGGKDSYGYGYIHWPTRDGQGKKVQKATRVAVLLHTGERVPPHLVVCHHCDNPGCVNPAHLFVGTRKDNQRDMSRKGRGRGPYSGVTHCKRGHELAGDNLRLVPRNRQGRKPYTERRCLACERRRSRIHARRG